MRLSEDILNAYVSVSGSTEVSRSTDVIAFSGMLVAADGAWVLDALLRFLATNHA